VLTVDDYAVFDGIQWFAYNSGESATNTTSLLGAGPINDCVDYDGGVTFAGHNGRVGSLSYIISESCK